MQTILGAGGTIGKELAKYLSKYTDQIRLVGRDPQKVNESDHLFSADLTNPSQVIEAVKDTEIAYLTVGLKYNTKIWQTTWPVVMKNVIDACKQHHTKLVFFDNIYMYDPQHIANMTEDTPINPSSKKGKVRAQISKMLMDEVEKGAIQGLIARSADFYGPDNQQSMLIETVFKNLKNGKKANWLGGVNFKHSFTYTPDAAKATALLGNTEKAFNQVWHLPTASKPLTGKQWIEAFAREMQLQPKFQVAGKTLVKIIGLFNPMMKELVEMMYQYDRDYVFDSRKFENEFGVQPTSYAEGIKYIVNKEYQKT